MIPSLINIKRHKMTKRTSKIKLKRKIKRINNKMGITEVPWDKWLSNLKRKSNLLRKASGFTLTL